MENASELLYMSHLCDSYAYKALFAMYEPMIAAIVYTCIKKFPGCLFSTEDLLQEGRLALLTAIRTYRNDRGAKFSTYASLLVKRTVQRYVIETVRENDRMQKRRRDDRVNEASVYYDASPIKNCFVNPEYSYTYRVAVDKLIRVVSKLDEKDREVLEQRLRGYTYKECANRLGMSLKTYDGRISRLRRKFKKCLYEDAD